MVLVIIMEVMRISRCSRCRLVKCQMARPWIGTPSGKRPFCRRKVLAKRGALQPWGSLSSVQSVRTVHPSACISKWSRVVAQLPQSRSTATVSKVTTAVHLISIHQMAEIVVSLEAAHATGRNNWCNFSKRINKTLPLSMLSFWNRSRMLKLLSKTSPTISDSHIATISCSQTSRRNYPISRRSLLPSSNNHTFLARCGSLGPMRTSSRKS